MLEPRRHKRADREDDRRNLIDRRARAVRQPDRQAHQPVTQHAERDRLHERIAELGAGDREHVLADRAAAEGVLPPQVDQPGGSQRTDEIAEVDQAPVAQQRVERHLACRPRHDDQRVAGEQLRPADDHQDQAEAECQPAQKLGDAERQHPARPGADGSSEDRAERDKRPGQHRQQEGGQRVQPGLLHADVFAVLGHFGGQEGIDSNGRVHKNTCPQKVSWWIIQAHCHLVWHVRRAAPRGGCQVLRRQVSRRRRAGAIDSAEKVVLF